MQVADIDGVVSGTVALQPVSVSDNKDYYDEVLAAEGKQKAGVV